MTVNAMVITEVKILSASDKGDGDGLGSSVAVSGDTVVVGAPYANAAGILRGQVYVFSKDQGGANNWGQVKILSLQTRRIMIVSALQLRFQGMLLLSGQIMSIPVALIAARHMCSRKTREVRTTGGR